MVHAGGDKAWVMGWNLLSKNHYQYHLLGPDTTCTTNSDTEELQANRVLCILLTCNVTWYPQSVRVSLRWVARNRFGSLTVDSLTCFYNLRCCSCYTNVNLHLCLNDYYGCHGCEFITGGATTMARSGTNQVIFTFLMAGHY